VVWGVADGADGERQSSLYWFYLTGVLGELGGDDPVNDQVAGIRNGKKERCCANRELPLRDDEWSLWIITYSTVECLRRKLQKKEMQCQSPVAKER